jgi:hypothetical protein
MNTNKEIHNKLEQEGKLYSTLKDGEPKTTFQKILAKAYPIILGVMFITALVWLRKVKDSLNWKAFIVYLIIGAVFGWSWTMVMTFYDPHMPGWMYHPWAIIGLEWGVTIEDIFFYLLCGALFYVIRSFIPNIGSNDNPCKVLVLISFWILAALSIIFFNKGGLSITIWFLFPGALLFMLAYREINIPRFMIVGVIIVIFASVWDIMAVTIIPSIKGYSWASQWIYITWDAQGIPTHSKLWLDYTTHRWAWIGNSPIEITPWFSICGWIFIYSLAQVCEKYLIKK